MKSELDFQPLIRKSSGYCFASNVSSITSSYTQLPCGLFLEPRLQAPDKLAERHSTLLQSSSPATGQPVNTFTGWPKQKRTRHTPCPKDNSRQTPFDLHQDRQPGPTHKHTLWKPSNQQKAEEHSL